MPIWCLHPDCLESEVTFATAEELQAHMVKAHGAADLDDEVSIKTLKAMKAKFSYFTHPSSDTVDIWRPHCTKNAPNAKICKNLFLKDKKKKVLVLCSALSETNTDMKAIEALLGVKNLRLASTDVLMEKLQLKKGGVTPLASINDKEKEITFVFDKAMLEAGKTQDLLFHPTSGNDCTIQLSASTLLDYFKHAGVEAKVVEFPPRED
eukprot:m.332969 g.332969  ORF g.332969 m.332969 type:complete len:208 (+) comp17037_c0_seq1:115-738(+)